MAGPVGYLGGWDAGVEPGGDGGVAEVVGAAGEQGLCFDASECFGSGLVEDGEVGAVGDDSAALEAEDPAAWAESEFLDVVADEGDEFGVDGDGAGFVFGAVF